MAHERATNRATSGETRRNQKTAGFPSLKGRLRDKQGQYHNKEKTANAHPHRNARGSGITLRVQEIVTANKDHTDATKDDYEARKQNIHECQKTRRREEVTHHVQNQQV